MDVPLQGLFFTMISYRNIMEKYFYVANSKDQLMSKPNFARLDLLNWEYAYLSNIKTNTDTRIDPIENQSNFQKKLLISKGLQNQV